MDAIDQLIQEKFKAKDPLDDLIDKKFGLTNAPPNNQDTQPPSKPPSALGSFVRSTLRGAPSAAVAGTVGRLGMAASPFISPVGGIALGLGGAAGGAYLTRRYQDALLGKVLSPETLGKYQAQEKADVETNPRASAIGDFTSQIASGFLPSPGNVFKAFGTTSRILSGSKLIPKKDIGNLANVGMGGAIAPAMLAGQNELIGREHKASDYGQAIVGGMLFNKNMFPGRGPQINKPPPPLPKEAPLRLSQNTESGLAELNRPGNIELTSEQLLNRANARLQPKVDAENLEQQRLKTEVPSLKEVYSKQPYVQESQSPIISRPAAFPPTKEILPTIGRDTPVEGNYPAPRPVKTSQELVTGSTKDLTTSDALDQLISEKFLKEKIPSQEQTKITAAGYKNLKTGKIFNTGLYHTWIEGMPTDVKEYIKLEPGFITDKDVFLTRKEAGRTTDKTASSHLGLTAQELIQQKPLPKIEPVPDIVPTKEETLPTNIQAALKRIKDKSGGSTLAGIPDPTILKDLTEIGNYYAKKYLPKNPNLGYFQPQIDKVKMISPSGKYLGEAQEKFLFDQDKIGGLGEDFSRKSSKYTTEERVNVERYLQEQQDTEGKSKIALSENEKILLKDYKDLITNPTYLNSGIRNINKDLNYYPQKISSDVINILLNEPSSPEAKRLKSDFIKYQVSKGLKESVAETRFKDIAQSYKSPETVNRASQFGPLDKAEGYGIPLSWRERNLIKNVTSYTSRAARRISYHKNIESDPIVREILNIRTDPEGKKSIFGNKLPGGEALEYLGAHEAVTPVMKDIEGRYSPSEAKIASGHRIVKSLMLGTRTGLSNLIGSQVQGWQHMRPTQLFGATVAGWKNLNKNLIDSTLAGVNKMNFSSLEARSAEFNISDHLNDVANIANKWQGKNILERVSRANNWGQGKYAALSELGRNKSKFLDDFGPKDWKNKKSFTEEELSDIASKYVNSVQGMYDYRGQPEFTMDSPYSFITSLSRWSVEKSNNYMKYVVNPLMNGDPKPFLMQTAGMVIGGLAVEQLLESLGGRKSIAPNLSEIKAGSEDEKVSDGDQFQAIAYKAMSLATLAGTAGIMSNLSKGVLDILHGNRPQSINDPLWEATSRSVETLVHAVEAIIEGEPDLGMNLMTEFFKDTVQGARMGLDMFNEEQKKKVQASNKGRDLKVFEKMHGYPTSVGGASVGNPFLNKDLKKFRGSANVNEIVKLGNKLVERAQEKGKDNLGLQISEFNKIRTSSRNVMPSFESNPPKHVNYYNWLLATQGEKKATELYNEYLMKEEGYDKVRKAMVPNIK